MVGFLLLPMSKIWGEIDYEESTFSCTIKYGGNGNSSASCGIQDWNNSPLAAFISLGIIFPLIIMVLSFIGIRRNTKSLQRKMIELNFSHNISKLDEKVTKTAGIICGTFVALYFPSFLLFIFHPQPPCTGLAGLHVASHVLAWCSTFVNPFIYFFSNEFYRKECKSFIQRCKSTRSKKFRFSLTNRIIKT